MYQSLKYWLMLSLLMPGVIGVEGAIAASSIVKLSQRIVSSEQDREKAEDLNDRAAEQVLQGNFEAAYQLHEQAIAIYRTLKDRRGEMQALEGFAATFSMALPDANNTKLVTKVIQYYQQALLIARELQDKETEENIIQMINLTRNDFQDYSRRDIKDEEQKLIAAQQSQDLISQMFVLDELGENYFNLKDYSKSIIYYKQLIEISRKVQTLSNTETLGTSIAREGVGLNGLAKNYLVQGDYQRAIIYYQMNLEVINKIAAEFQQPGANIGSEAFAGIGYALQQQNQPELAVVFYKQAVNGLEYNREKLREDIRQIKSDEGGGLSNFESAFYKLGYEFSLRQDALTYRRLADLLLQQNRIVEALQVLDLLKVQDLQDFLKLSSGKKQNEIKLLSSESEIVKSLPTSSQQPLQTVLQSITIQTQVQNLRQTAASENLRLDSYQNLKSSIQKLGKKAALFYPLLLDDRLELVIFTNDRPPIRKAVPITPQQLEKTIKIFRQQFKDRSPQIQQSAQELYQNLFQPIESELQAAGIDTIVYAPDSIMRYVPLAAFHDGKQWLAQRYKINYLTALALTPLDPDRNPSPRVLAAALTEDREVTLLGKPHKFRALEYTQPEVQNLSRLLPNTTTLIDSTFNRKNLDKNLPQSTILHLATHGMFVPDKPDESIILLGDGTLISLQEIERQWKFPNLSLVVLSACETAIGGQLGNGIEVLGFGYQMQRTGSRATISSLWTVDDGGTQVLMTAFYKGLQKGLTKAEALQQAQLSFIQGNLTIKDTLNLSSPPPEKPRAAGSVPGATPRQLRSPDFTHPYYWAPFILIGNGL